MQMHPFGSLPPDHAELRDYARAARFRFHEDRKSHLCGIAPRYCFTIFALSMRCLVTPTMAAKLAEWLWSGGEIVDVIDAWEVGQVASEAA